MFELYEHVRIKKNSLVGTIVDISKDGSKEIFIIESDEKGKRSDGYGGDYPLYWCSKDDIEIVT